MSPLVKIHHWQVPSNSEQAEVCVSSPLVVKRTFLVPYVFSQDIK